MNMDYLMVGEDEGLFNHEEADVLMVSFMIDAVRDQARGKAGSGWSADHPEF